MSRLLAMMAAIAVAVAGAAFARVESATGDSTPPPVTVPTTVPTVPSPDPGPLPQPQPAPAPKPKPTPKPAPTPAPRPAPATPPVHQSAPPPSAPSTRVSPAPAVAPSSVARSPKKRQVRPRGVQRTHVRKKVVAKPKAAPQPKPVAPARASSKTQTEALGSRSTSQSQSTLLLLLLGGALGAIFAATFLWLPRHRAAVASAGTGRRRRDVREVVAELVHVPAPPAISTATPALEAPTVAAPPTPPLVAPDEVTAEVEAPPFDHALLLPASAAAEAADDATVVDDEAAEASAPAELEQTCDIAVWRGYAKAAFYARVNASNGSDPYAVAESSPFRSRGKGTLERTEAAATAHRALVDWLVGQGWAPEGSPDPWYALRFHRTVTADDRDPAGAHRV